MAPWNLILRAVVAAEDYIVAQILRSPGWHRGVRSIHDRIQEQRYGRDPHEPMKQGEASKHPDESSPGFLSHFIDELRNQARGSPSDPDKPTPPATTTKSKTNGR